MNNAYPVLDLGNVNNVKLIACLRQDYYIKYEIVMLNFKS